MCSEIWAVLLKLAMPSLDNAKLLGYTVLAKRDMGNWGSELHNLGKAQCG